MRVTVRPRRAAVALGAIVALLSMANAAVLFARLQLQHDHLFGLGRLFDFNVEGNIPTFYSACALLFAAALFLLIAGDSAARRSPWTAHWRGLGLVFAFLSVDEAVQLHELLTDPMGKWIDRSGPLLFAWVVPYAVLTALIALAYLRFLRALSPSSRASFVLAGAIYVGGAFGMELIGGAVVSANGGLTGGGLEHWSHAVAYTLEESLEMVGVVIIVHALLRHIAERGISVSFRATEE